MPLSLLAICSRGHSWIVGISLVFVVLSGFCAYPICSLNCLFSWSIGLGALRTCCDMLKIQWFCKLLMSPVVTSNCFWEVMSAKYSLYFGDESSSGDVIFGFFDTQHPEKYYKQLKLTAAHWGFWLFLWLKKQLLLQLDEVMTKNDQAKRRKHCWWLTNWT